MTFTFLAETCWFVIMPFGLCNAPAIFQRIVDILQAWYKPQHCLLDIDDIIIFSETVEDHVRHADKILTILEKAVIKLM